MTGTAVESLGISESFEGEDDRKNPKENEIEAVDYSNGSVYIVSRSSIRKIVGKIVLPLYSSNTRDRKRCGRTNPRAAFIRSKPAELDVPCTELCKTVHLPRKTTNATSDRGELRYGFYRSSVPRRKRRASFTSASAVNFRADKSISSQ